jgi:hypothetical protein
MDGTNNCREVFMAGKGEMELSDGRIISNPTEDQIIAALRRFGKDLEHCNFTYDQNDPQGWVSAAGSADEGIYLYYVDAAGGEHQGTEALDPEGVAALFMRALSGDTSWREGARSSAGMGGAAAAGEGGPQAGGEKAAAPGERSLKDELLENAKRALKSEAGYKVNRLIRKGVRGVFGKRF